ncbi:hypothetical protein LR48_Vigan01g277000 [Vigna angularis]|uniref:CASP-like protein n=1 Tax=Phaseolus angularis TaxID=3914 RepID=A0A0L9TSR4_PHAAN|nr:hypothetical protein LR48_Vigan01g277000 [Vigna angularis]
MGVAGKVGDYAFKTFTAALGFTTIYLTATFSVNVYRGLSWHNAQTVPSASLFLPPIFRNLCVYFVYLKSVFFITYFDRSRFYGL